jgi:hypothetical protein
MGVLEALLAVIGLALLILLAIGALTEKAPAPAPPAEPDLAAPYREGLHAASRLQGVAQDLERELYAEAARQAKAEAGGEA